MEQTSKSIKEKYTVQSINTDQVKEWCLYKHYGGKMPSNIHYTFGCFFGKTLTGVAVFGQPVGATINQIGEAKVIELQRLVLNDDKDTNTTSFFVSQCLKQIPHKGLIVSYADANYNHHGYIYQATNWIYTGQSTARNVFYDGTQEIHDRVFGRRYGVFSKEKAEELGFSVIRKKPKHRYFYITGNRAERKRFRKELLKHYEVKPYPKGQNERYDASYNPSVQLPLF
jgi:hypothetical protein